MNELDYYFGRIYGGMDCGAMIYYNDNTFVPVVGIEQQPEPFTTGALRPRFRPT